MIYVCGSGPAGVSCAAALLRQGLAVTMLDAGAMLAPDKRRAVEELRRKPPEQWRGQAVEFLKGNLAPDPMGVRQKQAYGSDFPYEGVDELGDIQRVGTVTTPSLARGGLSNVWGAAILPYSAGDIDAWPVKLAELEPHYRDVLDQMDVSATSDGLAGLFPLYTDRITPLAPSRQAAALIEDFNRRANRLRAAGVHCGASRLAVRARPNERSPGCVYCGLCLYGCPYDLIYNSADALARLMRDPNFRYVPDCLVTRVVEAGSTVRLFAKRWGTETVLEFHADRVYLACGAISTTQILLRSLEAFDKPVTMLDSCLFLLPMARFGAAAAVETERLHTLSQAFIEIIDPSVSSRIVHAQIYTYNDFYPAALAAKLVGMRSMLKPASRSLLGRLLIGQCYLHSDFSPRLKVTLSRKQLLLEGEPVSEPTRAMIGRVSRKLWTQWRSLRMIPLNAGLQIAPPGRGFHSGGTFPMSEQPAGFASDVLGRPAGLRRVHVVDATVFPSIPATTITLSVMANARRIAARHGEM